MHQFDLDVEIPLQLFNTNRTEIAPRSNVVGKDFQDDRLVAHVLRSTLLLVIETHHRIDEMLRQPVAAAGSGGHHERIEDPRFFPSVT
jgi:hypothetical protein